MRNLMNVVFILVGVAIGFYFNQSHHSATDIAAALKAPDFFYTTLKGETEKLSAQKGKVVLLHFWATWCAPCKVEFPELLKLADSHPETITILAFSVDDSPKNIEKFVKGRTVPQNFKLIWDEDKKISKDLFQTVNYPETVLVGCDGLMEDKVIGMAQDWPATIKPLLAACNRTP